MQRGDCLPVMNHRDANCRVNQQFCAVPAFTVDHHVHGHAGGMGWSPIPFLLLCVAGAVVLGFWLPCLFPGFIANTAERVPSTFTLELPLTVGRVGRCSFVRP